MRTATMKVFLVLFLFNAFLSAVFTTSNTQHTSNQAKTLITTLNKVLSFVDQHYEQINFDGLLGVVFAEG